MKTKESRSSKSIMVVHVSEPPNTDGDSHLPFWGLKKSMIGPKEMGAAADFYMQTKTIYLHHS